MRYLMMVKQVLGKDGRRWGQFVGEEKDRVRELEQEAKRLKNQGIREVLSPVSASRSGDQKAPSGSILQRKTLPPLPKAGEPARERKLPQTSQTVSANAKR